MFTGLLAGLMSLLGSSAVGTLIGGLFAHFGKKQELEFKKVDLEHETKKWAHDLQVKDKDLEYARVEAAGAERVAFIEGESVIEAARLKTIAEVGKEDAITPEEIAAAGKWRGLLVFASAYRKSMRAVLTTVVGGAAIYVNLYLAWQFKEAWPDLNEAKQVELIIMAVSWLSAQSSMMFGYWFVSRGSAAGTAK